MCCHEPYYLYVLLAFIEITVYYNSFNPSFYFNDVMRVANRRQKGGRQSNGNSSFNLSKAGKDQEIINSRIDRL